MEFFVHNGSKNFQSNCRETTFDLLKVIVWNQTQGMPHLITPAPSNLSQTEIPQRRLLARNRSQHISTLCFVIVQYNVKNCRRIIVQTFLNFQCISCAHGDNVLQEELDLGYVENKRLSSHSFQRYWHEYIGRNFCSHSIPLGSGHLFVFLFQCDACCIVNFSACIFRNSKKSLGMFNGCKSRTVRKCFPFLAHMKKIKRLEPCFSCKSNLIIYVLICLLGLRLREPQSMIANKNYTIVSFFSCLLFHSSWFCLLGLRLMEPHSVFKNYDSSCSHLFLSPCSPHTYKSESYTKIAVQQSTAAWQKV